MINIGFIVGVLAVLNTIFYCCSCFMNSKKSIYVV